MKLKKVFIAANLIVLMLLTTTGFAVEKTRQLATDQRIRIVPYERNNVVPIHATTFVTTQVTFGRNEIIENIEDGDLDAWTINVQKGLPNMLFIKPTILGSDTNMTVITNLHTYYFHLVSAKSQAVDKDSNTYAIEFTYPNATRAEMAANLEYNKRHQKTIRAAKHHSRHLNWDYSFSGAEALVPLKIYDNGHFTYMKFRSNESLPAIFAVDNRAGSEAVVNFRREGSYIVIQQIAPQFTLRDGKYNVTGIFNNKLIKERRGKK